MSEPCKFWVGQKVVCIDTHTPDSVGVSLTDIVEGHVYTIREVMVLPRGYKFIPPHDKAPAAVRLKEVTHRKFPDGMESAFASTRFRPATDISSLEALLVGKPLSVKEDA